MLLHKLASSLKPSGAAQRPALEAAEQRLVLLVLTSVVGPGHANALELVMPCRTSLPAAVSSSASTPASLYLRFAPVEFRRIPGHLALEVLSFEPCEIDRKALTLGKPLAAGVATPRNRH